MSHIVSNQHRAFKLARKLGTARTDEGQTFKKPFQTVRRPQTVTRNMHDDFMLKAPKNVPEDQFGWRTDPKWGPDKEGRKSNILQRGREGLGRIKKSDIQRQFVEEASLHS